jgi:4-hydroxy-tetrahydrodipicolinate synthase
MLDHMTSQTPADLHGLWVPIVTPFNADDQVDVSALERLCRRLLTDGARGIVALGTTGEPAALSDDEQRRIVDVCAHTCSEMGGLLMVGTGTNSTRTTVSTTQELCGRSGVSAALVVVPYYTRPTPAGIIEHYRVVASESPVPIVAYNVPYRTGRELSVTDLLAIAVLDNVIGLKQSVGCLDAATLELLRVAPSDFQVLSGDDAYIVPTILMGGAGAIAAAAHVCTPQFATMIQAALAGNLTEARLLAERLLPVVFAGFSEPNPSVWKAALHHCGELSTPNLRAPMCAASSQATARIRTAIPSGITAGPAGLVPSK